MLSIINTDFDGSIASVTYVGDSQITYGALQLCITGGQCLWSRTWYSGNNLGPEQGSREYIFTSEDHNTMQPGGNYQLKFWFINQSGDNVTQFLPLNATIGDLNYDGQINVVDAVYMVQQVLGTFNPNHPLNRALADYNQDGVINVIDVVQLVTEILGPQSVQGQQLINQVRGNRAANINPPRPRGPVRKIQEFGRSGKPLVNNKNKLVNNKTTLIRKRSGKGDVYEEVTNPRGNRGRGGGR